VIAGEDLAGAWQRALVSDDVVALPLTTDSGTLGVLVAAHKEARAGTEPFAPKDARLLELFAIQVTVAMEYVRLTRESLERERLNRELEVAAVIQSHLHPREFPAFPGFQLAARSRPSRHVAGDTYDVLTHDHQLVATVSDVSGKGTGAGMIASGVHAGVRLLVSGVASLAELAARINSYLCGATADNRFATFVAVRLAADGALWAVNAGHCPALIRRRDGSVEQVSSSGLPLGIFRHADYSEASRRLEPGDMLVLYTDGLTEAESPDGEEFGVERVAQTVAEVAGCTADETCDRLMAAVDAHACDHALQDDATLLVVERLE
jgi:sigma-B regulation protein RsbU (phosphoserine phosphatase)